MTVRPTFTAADAGKVLSYDPETGTFRWLTDRQKRLRGRVAGSTVPRGYRVVSVCGQAVYAHRLAWLFVHGRWPQGQIDHINGNRSDNRISNLRLATQAQNNGNMRVRTSLGLKGVKPNRNRWAARIKKDAREIFLGNFATPEEAHAAYCAAARDLFGEFARGS